MIKNILKFIITILLFTTNTVNAGPYETWQGGTGITSFTAGDLLYASDTYTLLKLPIGSSGQVLTVSGGFPVWSTSSGGGGGSDTNWSFFNNSGIRLSTTTNQVLIGASATSTLSKLEVIGGASFDRSTTTNATSTYFGVSSINALSSAGLTIYSNSGTQIADLGAGGGSNATFNGGVNVTGNLTVDTNTLYVDATNNRVGIATSSPFTELSVQGNGYISGTTTSGALIATSTVLAGNGSNTSPSHAFAADTDTGIYRPFSNYLGFTAGGTLVGAFTSDPNLQMLSTAGFGWAGSGIGAGLDLSLFRDASDILALRRTTNTQEFRIYNTDSTDDEFASLGFKNNSNVFTIETEKTGAGTVRNIALMGGNVGISTTTPSGKLSVTNTGTGDSFIVEDTTSPDTTPFIIDANGNAGVGSSTPTYLLSVGSSNTGKFGISTSTAGCLAIASSGEVYSTGVSCGSGGGGASFGQSWEIIGGVLQPTTTIDVFVPNVLTVNGTMSVADKLTIEQGLTNDLALEFTGTNTGISGGAGDFIVSVANVSKLEINTNYTRSNTPFNAPANDCTDPAYAITGQTSGMGYNTGSSKLCLGVNSTEEFTLDNDFGIFAGGIQVAENSQFNLDLSVLGGLTVTGTSKLIGTTTIATTTLYGTNPVAKLTVDGDIETPTRGLVECTRPHFVANITADQVFACGAFLFQEDNNVTLSNAHENGIQYMTIGTNIAQDGGGLFIGNATPANGAFIFASSSPRMQVYMRFQQPEIATTTGYYFGMFNINPTGTTFETAPTQGLYVTSTTTTSNWQFVARDSVGTTQIDTGIASTTQSSGTGEFRFFDIRPTGTSTAELWVRSKNGVYANVASISTNIPTTTMNAGIYYNRQGAGNNSALTSALHFFGMRMWFNLFIP